MLFLKAFTGRVASKLSTTLLKFSVETFLDNLIWLAIPPQIEFKRDLI